MEIAVIIVAYNEEQYLPLILQDLLETNYPLSQLELVFIDNNSQDRTYQLLEDFRHQYIDKFLDIKLVKSTINNLPSAQNYAIKLKESQVCVRLDAHSRLHQDFFIKAAHHLQTKPIVCGRRPSIAKDHSFWSQLLLKLEASRFGSGVANYRDSDGAKLVKSGFHVFYHQSVFDTVGYYNEQLMRTEDNEFNYRLRAHGFTIYYDPEIISYQYTRSTFGKMLRQKYQNGYWIGRTVHYNHRIFSLFHFAPLVLVITLSIALLLSWWSLYPLALLLFLYSAMNFSFTLQALQKPPRILALCLFWMFPLIHLSYGIGTIHGLWKGMKK